jgi:hypothetical protein
MLTAVAAQHLNLRYIQDRAAPGLSLLRSCPAAPGGEPQRKPSYVSALRAACGLPHRGPTTSSEAPSDLQLNEPDTKRYSDGQVGQPDCDGAAPLRSRPGHSLRPPATDPAGPRAARPGRPCTTRTSPASSTPTRSITDLSTPNKARNTWRCARRPRSPVPHLRRVRNLSGNGVLLSDLSHAEARYVVSQLSVAQVPDKTVLGDCVAIAVGLDASLLSHRRHFARKIVECRGQKRAWLEPFGIRCEPAARCSGWEPSSGRRRSTPVALSTELRTARVAVSESATRGRLVRHRSNQESISSGVSSGFSLRSEGRRHVEPRTSKGSRECPGRKPIPSPAASAPRSVPR